ncbi:MAG: single-stranded-DNA-specific exonuclease RecJ, partial [Eggerthellaceae bacterium]
MSAQFNILPSDAAAVAWLQQELDLPHFMAATLVARGIDTPERAQLFMHPNLDRDWLDPYTIPGMKDAVDALEQAVRAGKRIAVFGDFDLDGISATTTMTRGLRDFGADAHPFIPHRGDEGYGISEAAIDRLQKTIDPEVVVTVDCGIACKHEAALLKERGIQVVITDHHEPFDLVPENVPVCDPKIGEDCPSSILAGVGVALKVIQCLGARFGEPYRWRNYIDFATLGTVADLMPMLSENRALVSAGIEAMTTAPRPCIAALFAAAKVDPKTVTASNLSFTVIPRLNAAGRMGNAELALDLLMADDYDEASHLAESLEAINDQRRNIEAELMEIASLQAQEKYHGQRAVVVAGEGWHEGVKGIVAGRLAREYGVPAILFTIDENGEAHGSGRVAGDVNLFKAIESVSDTVLRFGGHEAAVGITLEADRLGEFEERLCAYMDSLPAEAFHPRITLDACVQLSELTLPNAYRLDALMPFGQENEQPCYLARNVMLTNCRAVGIEKNHLSCQLTDGAHTVSGIMFHCHEIESLMACGSVVDAAFNIQVDEWRGRKSVKAMLKAISPVGTCQALEACLPPEERLFLATLFEERNPGAADDPHDTEVETNEYEQALCENRQHWEAQAAEDPDGLKERVVEAFIGEGELHPSQRQAFDALEAGDSSLAIMATGRGKSLIFQMYAAFEALAHRRTSIFVYPLRALIADQAYHLNRALEPFGISSKALSGVLRPNERAAAFKLLSQGSYDIVLTTPEFLVRHASEFAQATDYGFAVVDEAHHIGLSKAGYREAYHQLGRAFAELGHPLTLALTATADDEITQAIMQELDITRCIVDSTERRNLRLDDRRNIGHPQEYLANLVARGEKTVIYVNSRQGSVDLARQLRALVPQLASMIGFYNAGLSRSERTRVE